MLSLYDKQGTHTFFIPVDTAFQNLSQALVDKDVVAGHVVPDTLMFTNPVLSKEIKTSTYDSRGGIKVTAAIQRGDQKDKKERDKIYVKSNTVTGSRNHPREHVLAEIVKANIPVANGIVHLINRPLIIIASNLWEYLDNENTKSGRLSTFSRYVRQYGAGLRAKIRDVQSGTVFAPSNEAFERLAQKMGQSELDRLLSSDRGPEILGMHFLDQRIPAEDIRIGNPQNEIKVFLYHNIWYFYTTTV